MPMRNLWSQSLAHRGTRQSSIRAALAGALLAMCCGVPALADDTEIFVNPAAAAGVRPNLLLIIDTSGSMDSAVTVTRRPYDPAREYDGACDKNYLYAASGSNVEPPVCDNNQIQRRFRRNALKCAAAVASIGRAGFWTGRALQFERDDGTWSDIPRDRDNAPVECEADAGIHGEDDSSPRRYAQNGDDDEPWSADADDAIAWIGSVETIYDSNWLNWLRAPDDVATVTRLDVVKAVAKDLIASLDNINIGIMRFSNNLGNLGGQPDEAAEGGMVIHEVADLRTARASLLEVIDGLNASGLTPLSETLYEAGQYWQGRAVDYGIDSRSDGTTPLPSVAGSRRSDDPSRYRSPAQFQCQRNYTILLTDGEPTADNSADEKIRSLPGFATAVGASDCDGDGAGRCLDEMAAYLNKADLSPLAGQQNTQVYTIGFGPEVAGSAFLNEVAAAGGGRPYVADNVEGLTIALQDIVRDVIGTASTFTTPVVGINAFNRTEESNDLYISVFSPRETLRWPGNLKKYGVRDGRIVDARGNDAVDPTTGFFRRGSQSFWSSTPDEDRVTDGGAVERLPAPDSRKIFTYIKTIGERDLADPRNAFAVSNTALTADLLGIDLSTPTREQVIGWVRGEDVRDVDGDGNVTEAVRTLGDPLHARPALVSFGGDLSDPDPRDVLVLVPTNDGILHAIDAQSGRELWAFVAPELLNRLPRLVNNPPQALRSYGLDGDVRVLKFDRNQNGIVESGDRVWAFFGMRRGGRQYYALDITNRTRPVLKWILGPDALPGVGETWSTPAIARVRVAGARQNGENLVLLFGGGYDAGQQNYSYREDNVGNRIFMIDASSGELLWYAGGERGGGSPDLELPAMTHSIASRIVVIDIDGDQFADRLYTADLGGRVWRFDVFNGQSRSSLVTGGVFARLGAPNAAGANANNTRRFYYAPDVALIQRRGADPYYNLAIGSGYRGHPLDTGTHDRFYSLRDKNPFGKLTQAQYNSAAPLVESDLIDLTNNIGATPVPTTARGWRLELRLNGGWSGEKVLAEALTVNGVVLFPTYQPQAPGALDPCAITNGINRVYQLNVDTGKPAIDFSGDQQVSADDLSTELAQGGIASGVTLSFDAVTNDPSNPDGQPGGGNVGPNGERLDALGRRTVCRVGVELLQRCVPVDGVVRTFWQRVNGGGT